VAAEIAREADEREEVRDDSETISRYAKTRKEILDDYESGNFKSVVSKCLGLRTLYGQDAVTPDIGFVFALSLAKQKMFEEAIRIGEEVIHQFEASADLVLLRSRIAEWYLALGRTQGALQNYEKLTDTLDERQAQLAALGEKIAKAPREIDQPTGQPVPGEKTDKTEPTPKATSIDALLTEVEVLLHNNEFNKAEFLLRKARMETDDTTEIEDIDDALKKVRLAREAFRKQAMVEGPSGESAFETARTLIEQGKYEDALNKIEDLEKSRGKTAETEALKDQAIRKHIKSGRNRAAKLFLSAKRTSDPSRKKQYLRASYDILKALSDKYPSSPLIAKVGSDIAVVSSELERLEGDID
jgi:tetratricopeptide (TPR) repeat protein